MVWIITESHYKLENISKKVHLQRIMVFQSGKEGTTAIMRHSSRKVTIIARAEQPIVHQSLGSRLPHPHSAHDRYNFLNIISLLARSIR
jgi:hypothetical protein